MAFCPNCGAEVASGSFCAACGKPVGGVPSTGGPAAGSAGGLQDNVAGALCYLLGFITGILFLLLEPYNRKRTVRFHAFQSIFACAALFVLSIALPIVSGLIPLLGHLILAMGVWLLWVGSFVLWVVLMAKTYNGSTIVLPVIGPIAQKQAG